MHVQSSLRIRVGLVSLFLLATSPLGVHTIELDKCGSRLRDAYDAAWNATHPSDPPPPFNLTYEQCLTECGEGLGNITWDVFPQSITAWFLPWFVLAFQIPFGAEYPFEDVLAFLLTIGSPTLAAYSLQVTQLNSRWLTQAFSDINYPNSNVIPTVISALQHIPVELSSNPTLLPSLIVLPQNDDYWKRLLKSAKKIRRWSIPLIINFAWVIIAALLTIIDSFSRPTPGEIGYGAVTSLAYLLPLIIGWLHVGSEPEPGHLKESLEEVSGLAWVATDRRGEPMLAEHLVGQPQQAIEFVKRINIDPARSDESATNPIFNYSRVFAWSQMAEAIFTSARNAATKAEQGIPVGGNPPGAEGDVVIDSRSGTVDEVMQYCREGSTMFEKFAEPQYPVSSPSLGFSEPPSTPAGLVPSLTINVRNQEPSIWATGVWSRVALATVLALGLQWGTTGAAIAIHYKMRPVGLGCRTLSLLMYGISGTVSFFLLLTSSILAHLSRPQSGSTYRYSRLRAYQNTGAILCRWLGKSLAVVAGLGILVVSFAQPLEVLNNCWCSTTTLDIPGQLVAFHTKGYAVEWGVIKVWIGSLVMAFCTSFLFGFSIYLGNPRGK